MLIDVYKSIILSHWCILCRDPIPLPEKVRKPLTQVQQFNLNADYRAVDRAEFDQKVSRTTFI
jgi:hypothetical protein